MPRPSCATRSCGPTAPTPAERARAPARPGAARAAARAPLRLHRCPPPGGVRRRRKGGDVVGAVVPASVDEERRGTRDAAQVGGVDVFGDPRGTGAVAQVVAEAL